MKPKVEVRTALITLKQVAHRTAPNARGKHLVFLYCIGVLFCMRQSPVSDWNDGSESTEMNIQKESAF